MDKRKGLSTSFANTRIRQSTSFAKDVLFRKTLLGTHASWGVRNGARNGRNALNNALSTRWRRWRLFLHPSWRRKLESILLGILTQFSCFPLAAGLLCETNLALQNRTLLPHAEYRLDASDEKQDQDQHPQQKADGFPALNFIPALLSIVLLRGWRQWPDPLIPIRRYIESGRDAIFCWSFVIIFQRVLQLPRCTLAPCLR